MKKQAGFTLIELIMVIVILGVLSAFALPRFADLGDEARKSSIQGLSGALKSAANIAHAQWLAEGGTGTTTTLEGQAVNLSNGYPTIAGILVAAQVDSGTLASNDYGRTDSTTGTPNSIFFLETDEEGNGAAGERCRVTYTEAAANGAPNVASLIADC